MYIAIITVGSMASVVLYFEFALAKPIVLLMDELSLGFVQYGAVCAGP